MKEKVVLKRKIYDKLKEWKEKYAPDYVLFLKGARRVGKTTIAEDFGKKEYKSFVTINFQRNSNAIQKKALPARIVDYLRRNTIVP